MRLSMSGGLAAALGLALLATPAKAETVRAYILIEPFPDKSDTVLQSLGSLGNCLALTHSLWLDEIVAHIQCDGPEYLAAVMTGDLAQSEGVARASVMAIMKED